MLSFEMVSTPVIIENNTDIWSKLSTIGTFILAFLAAFPLVQSNWRYMWLKIGTASISPVLSDETDLASPSKICLILGVTNKTAFDIGLQLVYVKIYKKVASKSNPLTLCFGPRDRHPNLFIKKYESNEYFLNYNHECFMSCSEDIETNRFPSVEDIAKIKIEMYTTVGTYCKRIPKKYWNNIMNHLYTVKLPKYEQKNKIL